MDQGFQGAAPSVAVRPIRPPEVEIYTKLWGDYPEYRGVSPGEEVAQIFLNQARPKPGAAVLDLGCGTGRGGLMLAVLCGMDVTFVDFTDNCLDPEVKQMLETQKHLMHFHKADITKDHIPPAPYAICCDVMEHIPEDKVDVALDNCLGAGQHVFFQIATVHDIWGDRLVGHPLHLTVKPYEWWLKKFNDRECVIHWSKEDEQHCLFYVTAWMNGDKTVESGVLNISEDKIKENVKANIASDWKQATPHPTNDVEVMIVGGGPTLKNYWDEIKEKRADGVKLVCLNGAYGECIAHGLTPSALVMVDARPFNARFTKPVVAGCTYFMSSQCDPSALEGLPKDRTFMWHTTTERIKDLLDERYDGKWYSIPGGSTVLLRTIPLFRMLGFKRFYLYGCDSCVIEHEHHAYEQKENDGGPLFPVCVDDDRIFMCNLWMASQAAEMMDLIKVFKDEIELSIMGDGLLAYILNTGAEKLQAEEMELV